LKLLPLEHRRVLLSKRSLSICLSKTEHKGPDGSTAPNPVDPKDLTIFRRQPYLS
jgi:hypothetical protein